jgi:hypothetical protein
MPDNMCRQGKEKDLKLTGKFGIELSNCDFPFGGLLLQAIQFSMSIRCVGLRSDKQILRFLELAMALFLLLQKLHNPALQLLNLGLVAGIPVIQLLGHIHRGCIVLVVCLQCSFLICKNLKLKRS